jgi:DNA polymerase-3 subunit delta'
MNSFADFLGNAPSVRQLRASIAAGRLPHSLILAGPQGAGKYTLALLLAQALNCEQHPRSSDGLADICATCSHCQRIAEAADLDARIAEAVETRDTMRETDKKETRILIQTHPDVLVIPPDPPQLRIKIDQVRSLLEHVYYRPAQGERKVFIFTSTAFMKEAANALLKVLEEPPPYAHIIICAENPGELLPTIRSRCGVVRLGAIPAAEIESTLATRRRELKPAERTLVARLAQGAMGRALSFDIAAYTTARADALTLLDYAITAPDHTTLFKVTETYRGGADGAEKTVILLRALSTLLEDLLLIRSGHAEDIRNTDIAPRLAQFADSVTFDWIDSAVRSLDAVESGMRRNLLRPLSLDSFATQLVSR